MGKTQFNTQLKPWATINIKNMILSHEKLPGDNDGNIIRYELIDAISTIALKWILVNRINKKETIYSQCIKDIWSHLQLIVITPKPSQATATQPKSNPKQLGLWV